MKECVSDIPYLSGQNWTFTATWLALSQTVNNDFSFLVHKLLLTPSPADVQTVYTR